MLGHFGVLLLVLLLHISNFNSSKCYFIFFVTATVKVKRYLSHLSINMLQAQIRSEEFPDENSTLKTEMTHQNMTTPTPARKFCTYTPHIFILF